MDNRQPMGGVRRQVDIAPLVANLECGRASSGPAQARRRPRPARMVSTRIGSFVAPGRAAAEKPSLSRAFR